MAVSSELQIILKAVNQASPELQRVATDIQGASKQGNILKGTWTELNAVISVAKQAIQLVTGVIESFVGEAMKNQSAIEALNSALSKQGIAYNSVRTEVESYASSLQNVTKYSDEEVLAVITRLVQGGLSYKEAMGSVNSVLDLASARQMDSVTASQLLVRAYQGNTEMLKRYGIYVDEGKTAQEGFNNTLKAIADTMGGRALVEGQTFAGQLAILKNTWSDLQEKVGYFLITIINQFLPIIKQVILATIEWINKSQEFKTAMQFVATIINVVVLSAQILFGTLVSLGQTLGVLARALYTLQSPVQGLKEVWNSWGQTMDTVTSNAAFRQGELMTAIRNFHVDVQNLQTQTTGHHQAKTEEEIAQAKKVAEEKLKLSKEMTLIIIGDAEGATKKEIEEMWRKVDEARKAGVEQMTINKFVYFEQQRIAQVAMEAKRKADIEQIKSFAEVSRQTGSLIGEIAILTGSASLKSAAIAIKAIEGVMMAITASNPILMILGIATSIFSAANSLNALGEAEKQLYDQRKFFQEGLSMSPAGGGATYTTPAGLAGQRGYRYGGGGRVYNLPQGQQAPTGATVVINVNGNWVADENAMQVFVAQISSVMQSRQYLTSY